MGLLMERGTVGLALSAVVLQHFQNLIDGIIGVVEDRHRLYCYFLLYPILPPSLPFTVLPLFPYLQLFIISALLL